jgi:hypothetical protein
LPSLAETARRDVDVDIFTIRIMALVFVIVLFGVTLWLMVRLFGMDVPTKPTASAGDAERPGSERRAA